MSVKFRDHWGVGVWLFAVMLDFSFAFALWAAFDTTTALITGGALLLLTIYFSATTPLLIVVSQSDVVVGPARIEKKYIKSVELLNSKSMALRRTREADPRAFLQLRFWVKPGIVIHLNDDRDPHPYWLVSTKHGHEIKEIIESSRKD